MLVSIIKAYDSYIDEGFVQRTTKFIMYIIHVDYIESERTKLRESAFQRALQPTFTGLNGNLSDFQ